MVHDVSELDAPERKAHFIHRRHSRRHHRRWVQHHTTQSDQLNDKSTSLPARSLNTTPSSSTSCCKLAPNGTLTLGAAHQLVDGNIQIDPFSSMLGKLSLFRLWGRERSKEEVTSLKCTEGDVVMWWTGHWDAGACPPASDPTLRCGERSWNRGPGLSSAQITLTVCVFSYPSRKRM